MIKFDFESYNKIKLDNYNLDNIKKKFLSDNKMAGWYRLDTPIDEIKSYSLEVRENADIFIVVGIGGSYLGAKAVIDSLSPYFPSVNPEIIFVGNNLSSDYIIELLEYIKDKSVYVNVISKSGTTLETLISFNILLDYMKNTYDDVNKRIIITTDNNDNELLKLSKQEKYRFFLIPDDIGGRYSVLTPVGLLPIAVAGFDIAKLLVGAEECKKHLDMCYKYTLIRHELYQQGKLVESFNVYEPKMYYFTEWLKQLFAESQGKDNKGVLPISTVNTRDLHSLGQYFQDGYPIIFSTTIFSNSLNDIYIDKYNKTLNEINKIAMESASKSHTEHINTNIIELDSLNEENLGYLIFFFEMSAMLGSYLLGVNYYDQPGVNGYKDIMKCKLKKDN